MITADSASQIASRPQSFNQSIAMTTYTAITDINFEFGSHHLPQLEHVDDALNNVYSKLFDVTII